MTPEAFRDALTIIGWSQRGLADHLSCDNRMARRWASGELQVPPEIARWLTALANFHLRHQAPDNWRTRGC